MSFADRISMFVNEFQFSKAIYGEHDLDQILQGCGLKFCIASSAFL